VSGKLQQDCLEWFLVVDDASVRYL